MSVPITPVRKPKPFRAHLETYVDGDVPIDPKRPGPLARFRWRFVVNGRVLALSAESYPRRRVAVRAFRSMAKHIQTGRYRE